MSSNLTVILMLVLMIIILAIAILKIVRRYAVKIKVKDYLHESLRKSYQELNEKEKKLEREKEISALSLKNMTNALEFAKPRDGKRHVFVRTINQDQHIVVVFDEEYHYQPDYFNQHPLVDKEPYIFTRNIDCTVFIDGKMFDPLLIDPICKDEKRVKIKDLDCGKYKGRGLGTCVIQCLEKVLKEIHIDKMVAGLSTVDFHNKDKLYNFYLNKNGFELVEELTEHKWGHVKKEI